MEEVTFSDFVKTVYPYSGQPSHYEFIQNLFYSVVKLPNDADECIPYNDMTRISQDKKRVEHFFDSQKRDIPVKIAKQVANYWNSTEFENNIFALPEENKKLIINDFYNKFGISWQLENLEENLSCLLLYIFRKKAGLTDDCQQDYLSKNIDTQTIKMVPHTKVYLIDGYAQIGMQKILFDKNKLKQEIEQQEPLEYKKQLLKAYGSVNNKPYRRKQSLPKRFKNDFDEQRNYFLLAESSRRWVQDVFTNDGAEEFQKLEEDFYGGIQSTYKMTWDNGFDRLLQVQNKATSIQLSSSNVMNIKGLVDNNVRNGLCHILVNDGKIKSWVKTDE